jgi:hypothetical protein
MTQTTVSLDIRYWPVDTTEFSNKCFVAVRVRIDCAENAHLEDLGLQLVRKPLSPAE